ncbi:MAG TPA: anti-phage-associated DUF3780 domain-containing protein [Bryobacteraceae bacterium]
MTQSSARPRATVGFGCPKEVDPHHIVVDIPAGRTGTVLISEHYGIKAGIGSLPEVADRCHLPRPIWSLIAEDVKRDFNERLRAKNLNTSHWIVGPNKVERLLGKELIVLAWAVEKADPQLVPNAVRNWTGLRPEERWWLFTVTAAATGQPDQANIGWRKALRFALTENPLSDIAAPASSPRTRAADPDQLLLLAGFAEEGSPFLESSDINLKTGAAAEK